MFATQQVIDTERRFEDREAGRQAIRERLETGGVTAVNEPERVQRRKRRLGRAIVTPTVLAAEVTAGEAAPALSDFALERIIGPAIELVNVNYLSLALQAARSVGRIRVLTPDGRTRGYGTGFLVSPSLMLTNNHVLASSTEAASSEVDFDYEVDLTGSLQPWRAVRLTPDRFFLTDVALDFTLVAIDAATAGPGPQAWSGLIEEQGKALVGEVLNIIQHPNGAPKQIALRGNRLVDILPDFLHYETDTLPGSSGSPVFNDQWEVVALHHSGVPRRDESGRILTREGTLWIQAMGDAAIDWIANEGVRVSRIVSHVKAATLTGEQAQLRNELLAAAAAVPPAQEAAGAARATNDAFGASFVASTRGPAAATGRYAVPLIIDVTLGTPQAATQPQRGPSSPATSVASAGAVDSRDRAAALVAAAAGRPYYEEAADSAARDAYYAGLSVGADPIANYRALGGLLIATHARPQPYRPPETLYPWVDLRANGKLRSIYSDLEFDPETIIAEDLAVERAEARWQESVAELATGGLEASLLEAAWPYNCEHVVPQSWFGKRDPMKGDLHHLFTCEWACNSFRGNTPYFDFTDFLEVDRELCGRRVEKKFEPTAGKGAVARATLYFLLRYPGEIDPVEQEIAPDRIATLLAWHGAFVVDDYERHRNAAIAEVQGNRNPLVDHPEWAATIDFGQGLLG